MPELKPVVWPGGFAPSSEVVSGDRQDEVGYAIFLAQRGDKHMTAKPLTGLGPGVLEVVSDYRGDTFRAVYTVRLANRVFVLHAFQKKSKHRMATPQADVELIRRRLRRAVEISDAKG